MAVQAARFTKYSIARQTTPYVGGSLTTYMHLLNIFNYISHKLISHFVLDGML